MLLLTGPACAENCVFEFGEEVHVPPGGRIA
jgi:hypothetical protein